MMKIVFLDRETLGNVSDECFNAFGEYKSYKTTHYDEIVMRSKDADIVITNKVCLDQNILMQLPNLKMIAIAATGMNKVDLETADKMNIIVKNVQNYSTASVAQLTLTMALYFQMNLQYYLDYTKGGRWNSSLTFNHIGIGFNELQNKRWGIIGFGSIGKEVAKIVEPFGVKVQYYSTTGKNDNEKYTQTTLRKILTKSDIVSIHAPLTKNTKNLLREKELKLLKPEAILLNMARGNIINEIDLTNHILSGAKLKVGLDVVSQEPLPLEHPFNKILGLSNVVITPHIAWTSIEARKRLVQGICNNIKFFMDEYA